MSKAFMLIVGEEYIEYYEFTKQRKSIEGEKLIEKTDYSIDDGYNKKRHGGMLRE